jgi:hypothetical protein
MECKLLSEQSLLSVLSDFVSDGTSIRSDVVAIFIQKLNYIMEWFSKQNQFLFLSSSILLIYDGISDFADVKMIDFAHSFVRYTDLQRDMEYLEGLANLKIQLDRIADHHIPKQTQVGIPRAITDNKRFTTDI